MPSINSCFVKFWLLDSVKQLLSTYCVAPSSSHDPDVAPPPVLHVEGCPESPFSAFQLTLNLNLVNLLLEEVGWDGSDQEPPDDIEEDVKEAEVDLQSRIAFQTPSSPHLTSDRRCL